MHLGDQGAADVVGVGVGGGVDVGVDGDAGRLDLGAAARTSASWSSAGFIRSEWNAPATASGTTFMAPSSVAIGDDLLQGRLLARDDDVARAEQVGLPEPAVPGATRRQSSSTAGSSRPSTLVMPLGVATAAACIAWPRRRTIRRPVSKSSAPAKTRAVYSPRLSPAAPSQAATTSGWFAFRLLERRQAGDEDRRLAHVGRLERLGRPVEAERPQVEARGSPRPGRTAREPPAAPGRARGPCRRPAHPGPGTERRSWASFDSPYSEGGRISGVRPAGVEPSCSTIRSFRLLLGHRAGDPQRVLDRPGPRGAVADDAGAADAQQGAAAELLVLEPRLELASSRRRPPGRRRRGGRASSRASSCLSVEKRNSTAPSPALSSTLPTNPSQIDHPDVPFVDVAPLDVADEPRRPAGCSGRGSRVDLVSSVPFSSSVPTFSRPIRGSVDAEDRLGVDRAHDGRTGRGPRPWRSCWRRRR